MSAWHTIADSDRFRRFAKQGPGRVILRSNGYRALDDARRALRSSYQARRAPERFDGVRTFCCFVGHNKSGSSMVGALLDAHPLVARSDEIDALRYVDAGFTRAQLFALVVHGASAEARKGRVTARRLGGWSYAVPDSSQGHAERPQVIADSTTGTSTRRLGAGPELLDRLDATMGDVDVKLVQVIRNPFDPISVMMVRGHRTFANSVDAYFTACDVLVDLRGRAGARLHAVRYEDLCAAPRESVRAACDFLGVPAGSDYLDACASIIRPVPDRSRDLISWPDHWVAAVERQIAHYDFLDGYRHA